MKIIGIYDSVTEKYIRKQVLQLQELGYDVDVMSFSVASVSYNIKHAPCFGILKVNNIGYLLTGKRDFFTVLQWVKDSGI